MALWLWTLAPGCGAEPPCHGPAAVLSFTFDDGLASQHKLLQVTQRQGVAGTLYVVSALVGRPGYLSSAQLQQLAAAGWEVGAHSATHLHLSQLSAGQLERELSQARQGLAALGFTATSFATPWGDYNSAVLDALRRKFHSNRNTEPGFNCLDQHSAARVDRFNIRVQPGTGMVSGTTAAELERLIDQAAQDRSWLVLGGHAVDQQGVADSVAAATLERAASHARSRGVSVLTVEQVVQRYLR